MKIAAQFLLIQVDERDKYYEVARARPYLDDRNKGWYCEGFAQNNGSIYEFSLHLGAKEEDIRHKYIFIGWPITKGYNGTPVKVD